MTSRHAWPKRGHQRGYVLVMVLTAVAVMAFLVGELQARIDAMRNSARDLQAYAEGRVAAANALALTKYWIATRPNDLSGLGDARGMLQADGRPYRLADGAMVSVQDLRGLLSPNFSDRNSLRQLLANEGVAVERADAYIDTLLDYVEGGPLKRLNAAGRDDYERLGLAKPRGDWLRSIDELAAMPFWSEEPERLARIQASLGARRSDWVNPNTATRPVLRALFPTAAPEQIDRLLALRRTGGFPTARAAQLATGLDFSKEIFLPYVGTELAVSVWAPGLPRAIQYNLLITPGGSYGPWIITEQHSKNRLTPPDDSSEIPAFPLEAVLLGQYGKVAEGRN